MYFGFAKWFSGCLKGILMNFKQEYQHFKTLISQGSELLLLRLRLLRLDASEQLASVVKIVVLLAVAAILLLVGLIALMFGLNTVLTHEMKIWVFFGLTVACVLLAGGLLLWIPRLWRNSSQPMSDTLQALQEDLRLLNGSHNRENTQHDREKLN